MELHIKDMSLTQKIMAMEELWHDLSQKIDTSELTPKWHLDILKDRENIDKQNFMDFNTSFKILEEIND